MKKIMLVLIVIIVFIGIGAGVYLYINQPIGYRRDPAPHSISFIENQENKTLTVTDYSPTNATLEWNEVEITSGAATLPSGTIDVGDVITNCSESGSIGYRFQNTPTHIAILPFGVWNFTE